MVEVILILLVVGAYGLVHSWLASLQAKGLARRWLGEAAGRGYRLAYNLFAVLTLLPVLALPAALPDRALYTIPMPWASITLVIQGLALLALLVGVLQTGAASFAGLSQLIQPQPPGPPTLVTRGLYRYVRHPLYTAGLVFIWLTPLMTRNLLALYAGFSLYLVIGAYFEERKLLAEFGPAYQEYRNLTPMFVPFLK
jgi:methanethiol S-methyltransferase